MLHGEADMREICAIETVNKHSDEWGGALVTRASSTNQRRVLVALMLFYEWVRADLMHVYVPDYGSRASQNPNRAPMQRITASKEQSVVRVAPGSDQWKYDMEVSGTFNDSDLNNKLLPMDELQLDSDLYDRVSYLNLMSQYEERERQRKFEEKESLRRLREEPSSRLAHHREY
ncbi:unnamed protein product [Toxocara canis]|uniref:Pre-mRNA-splicing factor SLU7 n=1 Tax=Toxocara canis TaxID=6265 RepID=A0A183UAB5_TOXCA|nr:unnamed protein product [Toxocara canis]